MAIEGFDYQDFAKNLSAQAYELLPPDFTDDQKNYVANTLLSFSSIAGEALSNDTQMKFNLDQAIMITQIIAEWSFHKSVDLVRSGIPRQYWDPIMQKIAFTIFEIAKNAFYQGLPQEQCLQLIEHHVKKTYIDCVVELKDKNLIDDELMEFAANQSNIDNMVQEQVEQSQEVQEAQAALDEQNAEIAAPVPPIGTDVDASKKELPSTQITPEMKVLKLATLAMLFKKVQQEKVQTILNKIEENDANSVLKFMNIEDLYAKVDPSQAMQYLQEIKRVLPRTRSKITKSYVLERMQNISQYFDKSQIEQKLRLERGKVKRFAFTALEGEYYDIPPLVANVIATYIEDGV